MLQARISDEIIKNQCSSASCDRVLGKRDFGVLSNRFEAAEHSWSHSTRRQVRLYEGLEDSDASARTLVQRTATAAAATALQ